MFRVKRSCAAAAARLLARAVRRGARPHSRPGAPAAVGRYTEIHFDPGRSAGVRSSTQHVVFLPGFRYNQSPNVTSGPGAKWRSNMRSRFLTFRAAVTLPSLVILCFMSPVALGGIEVGACCVNQVCEDNAGQGIDRGTCEETPGGLFLGDGSSCETANCTAVPATSTWGMIIFGILIAICGTLSIRRALPAATRGEFMGSPLVGRALPAATRSVAATRESPGRRAQPALSLAVPLMAVMLALGISTAIAQTPQRFADSRSVAAAKRTRVASETHGMTLMVTSQTIYGEGTDGQPQVTGYRQTLRAHRASQNGQAVAAGCGDEAAVEVIANELTWGSTGAQVPTRVEWRLGAGAWQAAFSDTDVTVGMQDTLDLSGGGELTVQGKAAYPTFASPIFSREIASDHLTLAVILLNGDDPGVKMGLKGAGGPFGSQASIPDILAPYLDGQGKISLPANELIAMYELGSTNISHPSADYQDLVLKIRTGCPIGSEVVLRDSIGPDNTMTNGNWPFASDSTGPSSWAFAPATIPVLENVTLKTLRAIGAQTSSMLDFNQLDYWLRVWNSEAAAIASPNNGNIANIFFPVPSSAPVNFGSTFDQNFVGVKPTWDLLFDISSANLPVLAGQTIVIGVQVYTNGTLGGGLWGWMESRELGQSDMGFFPGNWIYLNTASISFWDGRLAYKLTGSAN